MLASVRGYFRDESLKIIPSKNLNIGKKWLKNATDFVKLLYLQLGKILSLLIIKLIEWFVQTWEKVRKWFSDTWIQICKWFNNKWMKVRDWAKVNKVGLIGAIPLMLLLYLIPLTFMLADRERASIGISFQILAGVILVFDQIATHPRIRKQLKKMMQNTAVLAFLITIIVLPFAISILMGLGEVNEDKWSMAGGIMMFVVFAYGMFLSFLTLLKRIKWLRRKDYVPIDKDKWDISDISVRNVTILFTISLLLTVLIGYLLSRFYSDSVQWIRYLLYFIFAFNVFMIFPVLIISALYLFGFVFAKFTLYLRSKSLNIWFWIFLFVIWAWGGLLLLINEF